jgi:DNA-binding beta-propeller fold protein YncE
MHRITVACLFAAAFALPARADIAVSVNDGHTALVNGVQVAPNPVKPDTLSVIEFGKGAARVLGSIDVPGSVVGPPMSVWVAPDESWAIVTSATKADPAGTGGISLDDRVSVVDLAAKPPKIVQSLTAGLGATVVRVSPDGSVALIANRGEGTVSVYGVKDKRLTSVGKVDFGNPKAGPSGVGFAHDGKTALVSRDGDNKVSILRLDGTKVTVEPVWLTTAVRPYTLDVNAAGTMAVVANLGNAALDVDSVSLIDLTGARPRVVLTQSVPPGPEGLKLSPDGKLLAVGSQMGTQKPPADPFYTKGGIFSLYAVQGQTLRLLATAPIGGWNQGIAFSRDGKTILLQGMADKQIEVFQWDGKRLTKGKPLAMGIGPEAIRTSWP